MASVYATSMVVVAAALLSAAAATSDIAAFNCDRTVAFGVAQTLTETNQSLCPGGSVDTVCLQQLANLTVNAAPASPEVEPLGGLRLFPGASVFIPLGV